MCVTKRKQQKKPPPKQLARNQTTSSVSSVTSSGKNGGGGGGGGAGGSGPSAHPLPSVSPVQEKTAKTIQKPPEEAKVAVAVATTVAEVVTKKKCPKSSKEAPSKSQQEKSIKPTQDDGSRTKTKVSKIEKVGNQGTTTTIKVPPVGSPRVLKTKHTFSEMREGKDPDYITIDDNAMKFETAILRGQSKEKIETPSGEEKEKKTEGEVDEKKQEHISAPN